MNSLKTGYARFHGEDGCWFDFMTLALFDKGFEVVKRNRFSSLAIPGSPRASVNGFAGSGSTTAYSSRSLPGWSVSPRTR